MKYKLLLLFITTTLFYFLAIAQTGTGKITGTITDIKGKPIAGATVILTAVNDTAITKTISANDDGKFVFKTIATGQYVINVSAIGYNGYISSPFTMDEKHILIQLPTIVLQPTGQHVLKDVVVTTKKPLVEHKIDRTIINVDAMISAAGGNALDVLTKSPGVMVDVNGGISLYGVSGVLVLIDDRPAYMSAQDLAAYLRSLPGGMIDKI